MTKFVNSLLTIAATSSLVFAQDGGWSGGPGKGIKYDGGDAFGIKISNQLQVHYTFANHETDEDTSSFDVRRARTTLSGHAFNKNIRYVLTLDAVDDGATTGSKNGNLKDGHVTWNFMSDDSYSMGLRMGQGKTQFGLEGTGSSKGLFFVERSAAARVFSDARSTGAWIMGHCSENNIRWSVGAMNGSSAKLAEVFDFDAGEEASNSDNEMSYVFAANWDPMGDFFGGCREGWRQGDFDNSEELCGTIGAALALDNGRTDLFGPTVDVEGTSININTAWSMNGLQFMGEWFTRTDDAGTFGEADSDGWNAAAMFMLPKCEESGRQWGLGARVSNVDLMEMSDLEVTEVSAVANCFYHGHACKTQVEYTWQDVDDDGSTEENHIFRLGFQLLF